MRNRKPNLASELRSGRGREFTEPFTKNSAPHSTRVAHKTECTRHKDVLGKASKQHSGSQFPINCECPTFILIPGLEICVHSNRTFHDMD